MPEKERGVLGVTRIERYHGQSLLPLRPWMRMRILRPKYKPEFCVRDIITE